MNFVTFLIDKDFNRTKYLSGYTSIVKTTKFNGSDELQAVFPLSKKTYEDLKNSSYLEANGQMFIISSLTIKENLLSSERTIDVRGLGFGSILSRRVQLTEIPDEGEDSLGLKEYVERLLNDNFINPTEESRKISMVFDNELGENPAITKKTSAGANVLKAIQDILPENVGVQVFRRGGIFHVRLYSDYILYDKHGQPVVVGPRYMTTTNENRVETYSHITDVVVKHGEQIFYSPNPENNSGLDRWETYVSIDDAAYMELALSHIEKPKTVVDIDLAYGVQLPLGAKVKYISGFTNQINWYRVEENLESYERGKVSQYPLLKKVED